MAVRALIFGTDDLFPKLKPFYDAEIQRGNLEIVGYAEMKNGKITFYNAQMKESKIVFQIAIISSQNNFYRRMKMLESLKVPRNKIIDGRIFQVPNLDFKRLLNEGVAYGSISNTSFKDESYSIYPRFYKSKNDTLTVSLDTKSYIVNSLIEGIGKISIGKMTSISWGITFCMLNYKFDHNYHNVSSYGLNSIDWIAPKEFLPSQKKCQINIGNDVWIGRGSFLKSANPEKPLIIGDGAVVAANSLVVKNVPPYAIVGGNPAQIIKYRFNEKIIDALLKIQWWNWDIDKIYENHKYFNRVEEFVAIHDK